MPSQAASLKEKPFYRPFGALLKQRFGRRVYKITVDAGMTCPNIDGSIATGGCTFCDNTSFSPSLRSDESLILRQIERGVRFYGEEFNADHFLAYFQTFSNTYASPERLKRVYDRALSHSKVVGMSIGTRPDCIDREKLELIQSYADDPSRFVSIEYGMQTMHDETGRRVNRGHGHQATVDAIAMTRKHAPGVHLCLHVIAGLPGETRDMMLQSIEEVARLKPDSIKIHHCYVYEGTQLADEWRAGNFSVFERDEFVQLVADMFERLPPEVYIQRMTGEINAPGLLAPIWGCSKHVIRMAVIDELERRGTHQGYRYSS